MFFSLSDENPSQSWGWKFKSPAARLNSKLPQLLWGSVSNSPFYALIHRAASENRFPLQDLRELFPTFRGKGEGKNRSSPRSQCHFQSVSPTKTLLVSKRSQVSTINLGKWQHCKIYLNKKKTPRKNPQTNKTGEKYFAETENLGLFTPHHAVFPKSSPKEGYPWAATNQRQDNKHPPPRTRPWLCCHVKPWLFQCHTSPAQEHLGTPPAWGCNGKSC